MAAFLTPLRVEWVDPRTWRLLEPLLYASDRLGRTVTVPAGFCTDFASVPRLPFAYLFAGGRATRAAVVHDYLYQTHETPRDVADDVFEEAARIDEPDGIARRMADAVRVFGAAAYGQADARREELNPSLATHEAP